LAENRVFWTIKTPSRKIKIVPAPFVSVVFSKSDRLLERRERLYNLFRMPTAARQSGKYQFSLLTQTQYGFTPKTARNQN
jgi:hypothetical protein